MTATTLEPEVGDEITFTNEHLRNCFVSGVVKQRLQHAEPRQLGLKRSIVWYNITPVNPHYPDEILQVRDDEIVLLLKQNVL